MQTSSLARYEFKRKLEDLREIKGRATELISLYIPSGKQIADVANYLRNEYAQSSNIKSKTTRKNVMWAIDSLIGKIKYIKEVPKNGIVLFVGHKAIGADQSEQVSHVLEPPEPIQTYLYRCDSAFFLAPLEELVEEKELYGLIVIDRKEATIGMIRGRRIEMIKNIQSRVPSKHGMGGQSQQRFERLIEQAAHEYFVKVGSIIAEVFLNKDIKGIIVGGPGYTKNFFVEKDYIHHELKKKIIDTFDTGYTDESGLRELVENASRTLLDLSLVKEKKLFQRFMQEIVKETSLAAYGEEEIRNLLAQGAVDILLLSEGLRKYKVKIKCTNCGYEEQKTVSSLTEPSVCPKCKSSVNMTDHVDLVRELCEVANATGAKTELLSTDTSEGEMLLKAFGGIAAILRFRK